MNAASRINISPRPPTAPLVALPAKNTFFLILYEMGMEDKTVKCYMAG